MLNSSPLYRISIGLSVIFTLAAFVTLLGSVGGLIRGLGTQPFLALLPWQPVLFVLLAALNCTARVRFILHRK